MKSSLLACHFVTPSTVKSIKVEQYDFCFYSDQIFFLNRAMECLFGYDLKQSARDKTIERQYDVLSL